MKHLRWRIYFALLASLLVFGFLLGALWRQVLDPPADLAELSAQELSAVLPPPDAPRDAYTRPTARLSSAWGATVAVFDRDGHWLGGSEPKQPFPLDRARRMRPHEPPGSLQRSPWPGRRREILLADGRRVRMWQVRRLVGRPPHPLLGLALVGLAAAAASYAVARGLTRRLERVQRGMEAFGAGDLSTRAPVEGRDEVAGLAHSFNQAAERIERLVAGHKALLANASHELRSPLARLRLAVELLPESGAERRPELEQEATRSLAEIDQLVEEILLASRLDAQPEASLQRAEVDLVALMREETETRGVSISAESLATCRVWVDERLVRRAARNLIDNAVRHGGLPVEVALSTGEAGRVEIRVSDHGPGVPQGERERLFEPFYRRAGKSEAESGVGLGLALVRRIARAHGGEAWVEAAPAGGAVFVLRIVV